MQVGMHSRQLAYHLSFSDFKSGLLGLPFGQRYHQDLHLTHPTYRHLPASSTEIIRLAFFRQKRLLFLLKLVLVFEILPIL